MARTEDNNMGNDTDIPASENATDIVSDESPQSKEEKQDRESEYLLVELDSVNNTLRPVEHLNKAELSMNIEEVADIATEETESMPQQQEMQADEPMDLEITPPVQLTDNSITTFEPMVTEITPSAPPTDNSETSVIPLQETLSEEEKSQTSRIKPQEYSSPTSIKDSFKKKVKKNLKLSPLSTLMEDLASTTEDDINSEISSEDEEKDVLQISVKTTDKADILEDSTTDEESKSSKKRVKSTIHATSNARKIIKKSSTPIQKEKLTSKDSRKSKSEESRTSGLKRQEDKKEQALLAENNKLKLTIKHLEKELSKQIYEKKKLYNEKTEFKTKFLDSNKDFERYRFAYNKERERNIKLEGKLLETEKRERNKTSEQRHKQVYNFINHQTEHHGNNKPQPRTTKSREHFVEGSASKQPRLEESHSEFMNLTRVVTMDVPAVVSNIVPTNQEAAKETETVVTKSDSHNNETFNTMLQEVAKRLERLEQNQPSKQQQQTSKKYRTPEARLKRNQRVKARNLRLKNAKKLAEGPKQ